MESEIRIVQCALRPNRLDKKNKIPKNYSLTYSQAENNLKDVKQVLKTKYNIDSYRGKHVIEEYRKYKLKREGNIYISKEEFIFIRSFKPCELARSSLMFIGSKTEFY